MKSHKDIDIYDFSDYADEVTGDVLFKINGGAEVENSHEGVAGANVGDTLTRKDGTVVVINQGDINYAKRQLGLDENSSSPNDNIQSTVTGVPDGYNPGEYGSENQIANLEVPEEIKSNSNAYAYYMALQQRAKEEGNPDKYKNYNVLGCKNISGNYNKSNSSDIKPLQVAKILLKLLYENDSQNVIYTYGISASETVTVQSQAIQIGVCINPRNELLHCISNMMLQHNNVGIKTVGMGIMLSNIDEIGLYGGIETGGGLSTVSGSLCLSQGYINNMENASGPYIDYGGSAGALGLSIGYDQIRNFNNEKISETVSFGLGAGSAYLEGHTRLGTSCVFSLFSK